MKLLYRLLPIAAASLVLCSCVVTSEHPLAEPESGQTDTQLVGVWHTKEANDESYAFSVKNAHTMRVVEKEAGKPAKTHDFTIAVINGESYMQFLDYDESTPGYLFVRYRMITGRGVVTTWIMDSKKAAALVRSGALKGRMLKTYGDDVDVKLTGDGAELARFLGTHGPDALFRDESGNLYRLR
jgi:hypothetical protein